MSFSENGLLVALLAELPKAEAEKARDICKEWIESHMGCNADDLADFIFRESCERDEG